MDCRESSVVPSSYHTLLSPWSCNERQLPVFWGALGASLSWNKQTPAYHTILLSKWLLGSARLHTLLFLPWSSCKMYPGMPHSWRKELDLADSVKLWGQRWWSPSIPGAPVFLPPQQCRWERQTTFQDRKPENPENPQGSLRTTFPWELTRIHKKHPTPSKHSTNDFTSRYIPLHLLTLCWVTVFLEMWKKCLLTPKREPQTQKRDTTKVQLGEPKSFIELINRADEGALTGTEMTQINCITKSSPQHGQWFITSGNLEPTAQPEASTMGWRISGSSGTRTW